MTVGCDCVDMWHKLQLHIHIRYSMHCKRISYSNKRMITSEPIFIPRWMVDGWMVLQLTIRLHHQKIICQNAFLNVNYEFTVNSLLWFPSVNRSKIQYSKQFRFGPKMFIKLFLKCRWGDQYFISMYRLRLSNERCLINHIHILIQPFNGSMAQ